jgi:putative methyltransferase
MKKKIYLFRFDTSRLELFVPMLWFNFKRYYELHGSHVDQWEWIPPCIDYKGWTIDEICEEVISHNADVYAFNSYMWSWNTVKIVAERVRAAHPKAILVLGGPHQGTTYSDSISWFKRHPYFDATCTPTEYGEWFLQDTLDQLTENKLNWNDVRNSFHRGGRGPVPNKRDFVFASNVLSTNLDVAFEYAEFAKKDNRVLTLLYETNRGCPYGCTYCEWGGGINTKVVPNSMENIEEDLSYFPVIGVQSVYITDANFGILNRDVEISKKFASLAGSIRDVYIGGLAKTSVSKRKAVLEPLIECGLVDGYQMSIQTVNEEVLKNIDRTDISVDENVKMAKYFIDKYDSSIRVELIIGLPGSVLDDFYKECDIVHAVFNKYGGVTRAPFFVLPDSPAANPAYINKWNLKLVPLGMEGEGGEPDGGVAKNY